MIPAIFDKQSVVNVAKKALYLNEILPCPFLIENPPVNFSLEEMHILDFLVLVSNAADCGIVLDIGHLLVYHQATGRSLKDMPLDRVPYERVVEIHMAGLQFSQIGSDLNIIDQHSYPINNLCWEFLREHIVKMKNLKGISLEQEYCENEIVLTHLRKARQITKDLGVFQKREKNMSSTND